jgi:hypothetical protein
MPAACGADELYDLMGAHVAALDSHHRAWEAACAAKLQLELVRRRLQLKCKEVTSHRFVPEDDDPALEKCALCELYRLV